MLTLNPKTQNSKVGSGKLISHCRHRQLYTSWVGFAELSSVYTECYTRIVSNSGIPLSVIAYNLLLYYSVVPGAMCPIGYHRV